ncbi:MAG: hypothetical protein RR497_03235, partial [Oscillospiraceae bacterium]
MTIKLPHCGVAQLRRYLCFAQIICDIITLRRWRGSHRGYFIALKKLTLFTARTFDHQITTLRCGTASPLSVLCTDNL